ncbi:MAG TPA: acyl-CoA dehydrogenase family protein [Pseudomonadales bacterium]|nr:acyl-CoA dehydrogenase family protein [Pseudomonadales bacterium]
MSKHFQPSTPFWPETHRVENQPLPLSDYAMARGDRALVDILRSSGAPMSEDIASFGDWCGSEAAQQLGHEANRNKPEFFSHDRRGERIDEVRFHPAYHELMSVATRHGLHSKHWQGMPHSHLERAAKYYLMAQVEAGHGCPITMTAAAIPALRHNEALFQRFSAKILHSSYDPTNRPDSDKPSLTVGMAMTEKQGGSDVRSNSTYAHFEAEDEVGARYLLSGHKYFVSAPMCDLFLVLAQTEAGPTCFVVPRWRPDGSKNPLQIQRLKNKMGNVSNASSETELRGAMGWRLGDEGRGVATIIDMVAATRFDCMIGSSAGMRQATAQAIHHCQQRRAFGNTLSQQPLMMGVLADLALESEASLAMTMHLANAFDQGNTSLLRLATAVGKYWICKRTPNHAYEAMECIGGSGAMEDHIMPRLFRESPINAIWEGSGNVQCLDVIRALQTHPASGEALLNDLMGVSHNPLLERAVDQLTRQVKQGIAIEDARYWVGQMALCMQANALYRWSPSWVGDAFCNARLGDDAQGWVYGTLPNNVDREALIARASPT